MRGLEARRRDTPVWIAAVQNEMIKILGKAQSKKELESCIQEAFNYYQQTLQALKAGMIPAEQLVINGKVSYALKPIKQQPLQSEPLNNCKSRFYDQTWDESALCLYSRNPDVIAWDLGLKVEANSFKHRKIC